MSQAEHFGSWFAASTRGSLSPADARYAEMARIGNRLRELYRDTEFDPVPQHFADLLQRLDRPISS